MRTCFPFLPLPLPTGVDVPEDSGPSSSPFTSLDALELELPPVHGFVLGCPRRSSHRTVPRVRPAISVFGFGAAGSAGKSSVSVVRGPGLREDRGVVAVVAVNDGEERAAVAHAGATVRDAADDDDAEDRGGNAALGIMPVRPTAERDDCAVDDFNLRTRFPLPMFGVALFDNAAPVEGPGRAG